jgi:ribosomal protein S14
MTLSTYVPRCGDEDCPCYGHELDHVTHICPSCPPKGKIVKAVLRCRRCGAERVITREYLTMRDLRPECQRCGAPLHVVPGKIEYVDPRTLMGLRNQKRKQP